MRPSEGPRPCREARAYYYDLLCPDEGAVPLSVRQHVAACPLCQEQVGHLREMLFEAERDPGGRGAPEDETIEALAEHFRLLDERVTCSDARPCLPQLAMTAPQIRIPTPISVHVDQCPQCARDLKAIRKLQLTTDQLRRLSQCFASANGGDVLPWPGEAEESASVGSAPTLEAPGQEALSTAGSESRRGKGNILACHEVSAADIFDSVVPFGGLPDRRQKAVAAHIRDCPVCLGRVQKLCRTIRTIVERADSEIETVYHTAEDTPDDQTQAQDTYQYPVSVEVVHAGPGAACDRDGSGRIWSAGLRRTLPSAASLAGVGAIVVLIVVLGAFLRTTTPIASGTNVGHVREAVEKAPNVRILVTHRGGLVQELWIAHRSNRLVDRTAQGCVLYDLDRGLQRTIEPQAGIGAPAELSKDTRDWARQIMADCLLDVLERVSPDTKLHPPGDNAGREAGTGFDIYELRPPQQTENSPLQDRWWVYLDPTTGLPQKIEFCRRGGADRGWHLVTTTVYTYPTEQQMKDSIRALFPAP
jgi:hypothetical protein